MPVKREKKPSLAVTDLTMEEPASQKTIVVVKKFIAKMKMFEIVATVSKWWGNQPKPAKTAFFSALIVGFVSHLFVYTGRYYGRDDMGMIYRASDFVMTGRWFRKINELTLGYILPLVIGLLVAFFLAVGAFYLCKLFRVKKKMNAFLIAGLLTTFPSIANTNLFLYDTANYHFVVMLGILAVYLTVKYKAGFVIGGIFIMVILATYQAKFNVVLAICLLFLIIRLLDGSVDMKSNVKLAGKFILLIVLGAMLYVLSLLFFGAEFNNYRGFSVESMSERVLSASGLLSALKTTYRGFFDGFFGNLYFNTRSLKYAYVLIVVFCALFFVISVIKNKLYKKPLQLTFIIGLGALIPLACNFTGMLDAGKIYGIMIYAFAIPLVCAVVLCERCISVYPVVKSFFTVCVLFIIGFYIVGNNAYYLKAYYYNQWTTSLTTRILARIDPLIPLSTSRQVTFFGELPNEYYPTRNRHFLEYGTIEDGAALGNASFISYFHSNYSLTRFAKNIDQNHGVQLRSLNWGEQWDSIANEILQRNMPAWPAEGCVDIVDGVIAVNFGITDVVVETDGGTPYFRARHYINEDYPGLNYEYRWQVYQNDALIDSLDSTIDRLYIDMSAGNTYRVTVVVKNTTEKFNYRAASIEWTAE